MLKEQLYDAGFFFGGGGEVIGKGKGKGQGRCGGGPSCPARKYRGVL